MSQLNPAPWNGADGFTYLHPKLTKLASKAYYKAVRPVRRSRMHDDALAAVGEGGEKAEWLCCRIECLVEDFRHLGNGGEKIRGWMAYHPSRE